MEEPAPCSSTSEKGTTREWRSLQFPGKFSDWAMAEDQGNQSRQSKIAFLAFSAFGTGYTNIVLPMVLSKFLGAEPICTLYYMPKSNATLPHYSSFLNLLYTVFNEYCIY